MTGPRPPAASEEQKRIEGELLDVLHKLNRLARDARRAGMDVKFCPLQFVGKAPPQGFAELDVIMKRGEFSI
jgi:hypothetical protein